MKKRSTPIFKPARRKRIFEDIIEQIENAILSGRLKNGEKLPHETVLQTRFKTSRQTVKEALRVLEGKGLVRIISGGGGGSFVNCLPENLLADKFDMLTRFHHISIQDLVQLREKLEGTAAELAAQKAGPLQINRMEQTLDLARDYYGKGDRFTKRFVDADKNLHLTLAQAAGNPLIVYSLRAIYNLDEYFSRFYSIEKGQMAENLHDMINIVMAVANHNADAARNISIRHIRKFNHHLTD